MYEIESDFWNRYKSKRIQNKVGGEEGDVEEGWLSNYYGIIHTDMNLITTTLPTCVFT